MADETPRIRIDLDAHQVWVGGQAVHFTTKQYGILSILAANPGKAITRATLMEEVWGHTWGVNKSLDMHISWVRRKLDDDPRNPRCIATVRGIGWRLEPGSIEIVRQPAPSDLTRVVLVRPGDVLVFGNVGPFAQQASVAAGGLRDQLGLAAVVLFPGDIDMAAVPGAETGPHVQR